MKIVIILMLIIGSAITLGAQDLRGTWQESSSHISAGYLNTYRFFKDSTFLFSANEYFGLKSIVSLGGKYKYDSKKKLVVLSVEFLNVLQGGTVKRGNESGSASGLWVIEGGSIKKTKMAIPLTVTIQVESVKSEKDDTILMLFDNMKYYKIEEN